MRPENPGKLVIKANTRQHDTCLVQQIPQRLLNIGNVFSRLLRKSVAFSLTALLCILPSVLQVAATFFQKMSDLCLQLDNLCSFDWLE